MNSVIKLSRQSSQCIGCLNVRISCSTDALTLRHISTTVPLQRVKRQQKKFRPKIPPFHLYGETHRLLRGASLTLDRYGPLFDHPDYTFLDGRPTPLTPEQKKAREEQRDLAGKVVKYLQDMENVKEFNAEKIKDSEQLKQNLQKQKLKAKS